MNCQEICERLDGFVDGELTEAELQEVELHLAQCSTCREEARALRTLVAEAAALPRELAPSRDLWPAIALQVESPRRPAGDKRHARAWVWGGLAAAAALFLAALLWRSGEWQGVPAASPQDGVARPVTFEAERDYDRAAAELLSALEAQRAALTPGWVSLSLVVEP